MRERASRHRVNAQIPEAAIRGMLRGNGSHLRLVSGHANHLGRHAARLVAHDIDLTLGLNMEALRHVRCERLRCGIGRHTCRRLDRVNRANDHHSRLDLLRLIPLHQLLEHHLRCVGHVVRIDLHLSLDILIGHLDEGISPRAASAQHQDGDVDGGELVRDGGAVLFDGAHLPEVGDEAEGFEAFVTGAALFFDFSELFVDFLLAAGDDADVEAFAGQLFAHGEADAVGSAGDDGPAVAAEEAAVDSRILPIRMILLLAP